MWETRIGGHFQAMKKCDINMTQSFCDNGLLWLKDYTKTVKCVAEIGQRVFFCSVHIRPLVSRAPGKLRKEMEPTGAYQSLSASSPCLKNDTGVPLQHLFKEKSTDRCQGPRLHPLFLNSQALHLQPSHALNVQAGSPDLWASEERVLESSVQGTQDA